MSFQKISLIALRVVLGWTFFYAGITKVLDPKWSAEGYLKGAKTFPAFYHMLINPSILPFINFLNEWGLTLIGAFLILGLFLRWSAIAGAVLMLLYYFPVLNFPYPNANSFIVDEHIIYIAALILISSLSNKKAWSMDW